MLSLILKMLSVLYRQDVRYLDDVMDDVTHMCLVYEWKVKGKMGKWIFRVQQQLSFVWTDTSRARQ